MCLQAGWVWNGEKKKQCFCVNHLSHCLLPACSLISCCLCLSLPHCIFPRLRRPWTLWLRCLHYRLGALWQLSELFASEGRGSERRALDGTQNRQHQEAQLETRSWLSNGDNPPPRAMTGQLLSLLTPLALLLFVGFADLSLASVEEDEDNYMQEMLTRERYNQVRMPEKSISSTANAQGEPKQKPARKMPKGEMGNDKKTDKIPDSTKPGKRRQIVLHGKLRFWWNFLSKLLWDSVATRWQWITISYCQWPVLK